MKIYEYKIAPNPLRVQMFLSEKDINVETVQVDVRNGENRKEEYLSINPKGGVPSLALDDGTVITESIAICRYFEAIKPEPSLFGNTPEEKGLIEMWSRRTDIEGISSVADALRNFSENFKDRAVPDPRETKQIPELAKRGVMLANRYLDDANEKLEKSEYLAGDKFSMADINLYVLLYFANWVKVKPKKEHTNLIRWKELVSKRESAKVFEN